MLNVLEGVLSRSRAGRVQPPKAPVGFVPHISTTIDDDHDGDDLTSGDELFGQSFGLVYRASDGAVTNRRITVRKIARSLDGNLFLRCFCWEREAPRSFRIDRIETLFRITTGEIVGDPIRFFARYIGPPTADEIAESILGETRDGLRVLLFLARCDGSDLIEEHEPIRWYVEQRAGERQFSWEIIEDFLNSQHPDTHLACKGLRKISSDANHARCLLAAAARVIAADGDIVGDETTACVELERILERL